MFYNAIEEISESIIEIIPQKTTQKEINACGRSLERYIEMLEACFGNFREAILNSDMGEKPDLKAFMDQFKSRIKAVKKASDKIKEAIGQYYIGE